LEVHAYIRRPFYIRAAFYNQENYSVKLLNITDADVLIPIRVKASMHDRVLSRIRYYNWNTLRTPH